MALLSAASISEKMKSEFDMGKSYSIVLPPRFDEWPIERRALILILVSNVNQVYMESWSKERARVMNYPHRPPHHGCTGESLAEENLRMFKEMEEYAKRIGDRISEAVTELKDALARYHDIEHSTRVTNEEFARAYASAAKMMRDEELRKMELMEKIDDRIACAYDQQIPTTVPAITTSLAHLSLANQPDTV